jgi:hypothetical protein
MHRGGAINAGYELNHLREVTLAVKGPFTRTEEEVYEVLSQLPSCRTRYGPLRRSAMMLS